MNLLSDNFHPHIEVRINYTDVVIMEQSSRQKTEEFAKD